jgi:glyoxylase-like metal-dependent hydrolase (beta-lactamase superfamily II)
MNGQAWLADEGNISNQPHCGVEYNGGGAKEGLLGMIHEVLSVGMLACNCSILGDEESGEAIVIDPGDEVERIQEVLARRKLHLKYIVATHAHLDHVGGLEPLKRATGAAALMHEADLPLYQNLPLQAEWLGIVPPAVAEIDRLLKDGDAIHFGSHVLDVLHTPGHSPGSISLHLRDGQSLLFSGDTLFQGGIGRTDLWGGSYEELLRSIRDRLLVFPDETPVFPGHGPATLIGEERETNQFLQDSI